MKKRFEHTDNAIRTSQTKSINITFKRYRKLEASCCLDTVLKQYAVSEEAMSNVLRGMANNKASVRTHARGILNKKPD